MAQATTKYVWQPDEATLERANVVRLMRKHGFDDYWELVARSQEDPEWFWPAAIEDMGLEFSRPWDAVVDLSRGPEWATWFVGGKLNIAWNCVHRWAERRPDAIASVGLGRGRVAARADVRRALGRGDAARRGARPARRRARATAWRSSCRCRPRCPIASHACAHIGAIQVPIFSGFAAPAVAQRLQASEAKVAITTRASTRRGREVPMLEILEEARREAPSVEHVVVAPWDELVADSPGRAARRPSSTRRRRTCSRTRPGRPAPRRASSTSRAASSSRSRARSATRPTRGPTTGSTSSRTWAGSWARGPSSAGTRWARRSSSPRARPTGRRTGSGS